MACQRRTIFYCDSCIERIVWLFVICYICGSKLISYGIVAFTVPAIRPDIISAWCQISNGESLLLFSYTGVAVLACPTTFIYLSVGTIIEV